VGKETTCRKSRKSGGVGVQGILWKQRNKMIIENGKKVKCPICGSTNVEAVLPFDYVKQCENKDCSYHKNHPKKWKYQFVTGQHN
jgi:hypothetical protein